MLKSRRPFCDRFKILLELENYTDAELASIGQQYLAKMYPNDSVNANVVVEMAGCARNTPRLLIRLLEAVVFSGGNHAAVLNNYNIIKAGYTTKDLKALKYIEQNDKGCGVNSIASYLGTSVNNFSYDIEPYLIQNNLIVRTPRGRKITDDGKNILKQFQAYLKTKGYGENHLRNIKPYLAYCSEKGIEFKSITFEQYSEFLNKMQEEYEVSTVNTLISAVRCFYNHLLSRKEVGNEVILDVIQRIGQYRVGKKIPDFFTPEEMADVVKDAMSFGDIHPIKMRAILWFMFYSGLRRNEMLTIKRQSFNLPECEFFVRLPTKNKTERVGYIPTEVRDMVKEYFSIEPEKTNAFNITLSDIKYMFVRLNDCLKAGKSISPHTMRHSFAMMLVDSGVEVAIAQKMLGHASIEATMVYYRVREKLVQETYKKKVKFKGKIK
jgi:integrase/recombinase XerD